MATRRLAKINRIMREEISTILLIDVRDPRIEGVTVTEVVTSGDTRHAKIFFTVLGGEENVRSALEGLQHAAPYVRKLLSQRVSFRFTPELDFRHDDVAAKAARVIDTLEAIRREEGFGDEPAASPRGEEE